LQREGSIALRGAKKTAQRELACLADIPLGAQEERAKHLMWVSMRGIGGTLLLLRHLLQGAQTVMVDTYPSGPRLWSELIDKHQLNSHLLFGAAMHQTLQELPHRTFESVRNILYGGSCFAPTLIQRSMEQFPNAGFLQGYGMTEVHPMTMLGPDSHKRAGEASQGDVLRMSSAGRPLAPGSVFIEDLEQPGSGKPPPAGKDGVGQICARSPSVTMMGYYANPEKTAEAMPDGKFVRTGDIGRFDEDGFLYILGRVKDIIPAYKGFNVAPRDIEEVLYSHPGVGQASVVGVWTVVAWVRAKAGAHLRADELREHIEQSGLAKWQMPDAIHVSHEALPTTGGKVDAKALRAPAFRRAQLAAEGADRFGAQSYVLLRDTLWLLGSAGRGASSLGEGGRVGPVYGPVSPLHIPSPSGPEADNLRRQNDPRPKRSDRLAKSGAAAVPSQASSDHADRVVAQEGARCTWGPGERGRRLCRELPPRSPEHTPPAASNRASLAKPCTPGAPPFSGGRKAARPGTRRAHQGTWRQWKTQAVRPAGPVNKLLQKSTILHEWGAMRLAASVQTPVFRSTSPGRRRALQAPHGRREGLPSARR